MTAKTEILNAAVKVFAANGYCATTTFEIAKICDATQPLIYYYYKSKRELFIAACLHAYDNDLIAQLHAMLAPEVIKNSDLILSISSKSEEIKAVINYIDSVLLCYLDIDEKVR